MNIVSRASEADVFQAPFAHLELQDAIDEALCSRLIHEFPPLELFTKGRGWPSNHKIYCPAVVAMEDPRVPAVWKDVIRQHTTPDFFREVARLFRSTLREQFPGLDPRDGSFDRLRVGLRGRDRFGDHDVLIDAQITIHTPVVGPPCAERRPHIKTFDKLYSGYLYLRSDDDRSEGADHEFFSIRGDSELRCRDDLTVDPGFLKLEKAVRYRKNTVVIVFNGPRAVQGNGVRSSSDVPMRYLNVNAQWPRNLFTVAMADARAGAGMWWRLRRLLGFYFTRR